MARWGDMSMFSIAGNGRCFLRLRRSVLALLLVGLSACSTTGETFRSAGLDLLVVLWFRGQQLTMVSLMDPDPRFGTSWADYSGEKEMARKASHDAWLARALAPDRNASWGSVWSGYDERGGFSDIVVKYAAAG